MIEHSSPLSNYECLSGVLAIGDAEVDLALCKDVGEPLLHDLAARGADDVTDKQDLQWIASFASELAVHNEEWSGPLRRASLGPEPHK